MLMRTHLPAFARALSLALPLLLLAPGIAPAQAANVFTPFGNAIREWTNPKPAPPARVGKSAPKKIVVEEEAPIPQTRPAEAGGEAKPEPEKVKPEVEAPAPVVTETAPVVPLPRDRPEEDAPAIAEPAAPPPAPPAAEVTVNKAAEPVAETPDEPERIYQTACPALTMGAVEGKMLPPIHEGQCGLQSPLTITAVLVNGRMVPINGDVTTDCAMATMLPEWVASVDGYAWATDNTRISAINIGTSYMCRSRVGGTSTDKLSEHGFADALDIIGFSLEDGRKLAVDGGWTGTPEQGSALLRYAHDAACSRFMTTLGPEANAEHHDHLHLDMGCHGKTCTARLCE